MVVVVFWLELLATLLALFRIVTARIVALHRTELHRFHGFLSKRFPTVMTFKNWFFVCVLALMARVAQNLDIILVKQKFDVFIWKRIDFMVPAKRVCCTAFCAFGPAPQRQAEIMPSICVVPLDSRSFACSASSFALPKTFFGTIDSHIVSDRISFRLKIRSADQTLSRAFCFGYANVLIICVFPFLPLGPASLVAKALSLSV
jgi:hypothetical protein